MSEIRSAIEPVRTRKRRSKHTQKRRKTFFWLLIILLITFMLSAFTMSIPFMINRYLAFTDKTDSSMDTYRTHYEQARKASAPTRK